MTVQTGPYPVQFNVDYPVTSGRLGVLFRVILIIPIVIVLFLISGSTGGRFSASGFSVSAGGLLLSPVLVMILFRQKYPRWWFEWNLALLRFGSRVAAYLLLLRDEYPSTDDEQSVHLEISYPNAQTDLNRWLPLIKWLLAIPHFIVLLFLGLAAVVITVISWFAILFTGRYPRGLHDYIVGVLRWGTRVQAYALLLVTDRYPPFSLRP